MEKQPNLVDRILGVGVRLLAYISAIAVFWLMGLTVVAVIMRYVFRSPILGAQDISQLSLVLVIYPALAYCGWTGGHVALDLASTILRARALRWTDTMIRTASALLFLYIAWVTLIRGLDALKYGDASNLIGIPYYPFFFMIAVGSLAYALVLFVHAVQAARGIQETKEQ